LHLAAAPGTARADPSATMSAATMPLPSLAVFGVTPLPTARLVGSYGGGGGGRALLEPSGVYVGLDAGGALMTAAGDAATTGAPAFGLHAGYRLPSGLAFDVRGDDLGVYAPAGGDLCSRVAPGCDTRFR
jgi:hypothetical protein